MTEMSVAGAVDFTAADLTDPLWWRSLWMRMSAYERMTNRDYYRSQVSNVIKLLCRPRLSTEAAEGLENNYDYYTEALRKALWPWQRDEDDTDVIASLTASWEARWGNPNDPEVQKAIQKTIDALNNAGKWPGKI